jgi:hypothetical protein
VLHAVLKAGKSLTGDKAKFVAAPVALKASLVTIPCDRTLEVMTLAGCAVVP